MFNNGFRSSYKLKRQEWSLEDETTLCCLEDQEMEKVMDTIHRKGSIGGRKVFPLSEKRDEENAT